MDNKLVDTFEKGSEYWKYLTNNGKKEVPKYLIKKDRTRTEIITTPQAFIVKPIGNDKFEVFENKNSETIIEKR